MSKKNSWFEVDKEGLAKLLRRRGMEFVLFELLQNCYDTGAGEVTVWLESYAKGRANLTVIDDDPNGFQNLDHAFTLFAESTRKADPSKRGRFNLGEKLILAVCDRAEIRSTSGTIIFDINGTRRRSNRNPQASGSIFSGTLRMTKPELEAVLIACRYIIPPISTMINGHQLVTRKPIREFTATLPTEIADQEGILRRSARQTIIRVYEKFDDNSRLYEMGIPVVETDDPWDIEIMQKVPLNIDRDNVTPAYLRQVRTLVLNEMHSDLADEDASLPAIMDALPSATPEAVNSVLAKVYGEKRAIYDPSDMEANRTLQSEGYQLIAGNSFSKSAWKNIRESKAAIPAGQIRPTYKPYSPDGDLAVYMMPDDWTPGMRNIADYIEKLGKLILKKDVSVMFERGRIAAPFAANYGSGILTFNYERLGKKWFDKNRADRKLNELIIHELAHEYGQHLTKEFDDALAMIGAAMIDLALEGDDLDLFIDNRRAK